MGMTCCGGSGCCGRWTLAGSRRPRLRSPRWLGGCGRRPTRSGAGAGRAPTRRGRSTPRLASRSWGPVHESRSRRRALAHASPLELPRSHRRARLRPKIQPRQPRAIPDAQWEELFGRMRCTRDRALLACYVSSGARASELLGLRLGDIDWQGGQLWVISKGTRLRQPVPASPEAFAYLGTYLDEAGLPAEGGPVWRTRRGESRPLSYWA